MLFRSPPHSCSAFFYKQLTFFFFCKPLLYREAAGLLPLHPVSPASCTSNSSFLCRLLRPNEPSRWSPPCWPPSPDLPQFAVHVCPLGLSSLLGRGKLAAPSAPILSMGLAHSGCSEDHLEAWPVSEPWAVGLTELGGRGTCWRWASRVPRGQCTHGTVSPDPTLPSQGAGPWSLRP